MPSFGRIVSIVHPYYCCSAGENFGRQRTELLHMIRQDTAEREQSKTRKPTPRQRTGDASDKQLAELRRQPCFELRQGQAGASLHFTKCLFTPRWTKRTHGEIDQYPQHACVAHMHTYEVNRVWGLVFDVRQGSRSGYAYATSQMAVLSRCTVRSRRWYNSR